MKRTLEKNLDEHLDGGAQNYKKIQALITTISNEWESRLKNKECNPSIKNKVIYFSVFIYFFSVFFLEIHYLFLGRLLGTR